MKSLNIDSEALPESSSFMVKVIHRMSTLLTKKTAAEFSSITDFNIVEWRVVSGIYAYKSATQKMLVEYSGGDQAQTSRILSDLRAKGVVRSELNGKDRRARNFELTEMGLQSVQAAFPAIASYFARIEDAVTAAEKESFIAILNKLLEAAEPTQTEQAERQ